MHPHLYIISATDVIIVSFWIHFYVLICKYWNMHHLAMWLTWTYKECHYTAELLWTTCHVAGLVLFAMSIGSVLKACEDFFWYHVIHSPLLSQVWWAQIPLWINDLLLFLNSGQVCVHCQYTCWCLLSLCYLMSGHIL